MYLNVVVLFQSSCVRNSRSHVGLCMVRLDLKVINISKDKHGPIILMTNRLAFF
jgi:hypothetical protein